MVGQRDCVGLDVPPGPEAVEALGEALREALAGRGPAIALLPGGPTTAYTERLRAAVRPGEPVPDEVAVVAATSGSTGDPAGVLIPGPALQAAADGFAALVAIGPPGTHRAGHPSDLRARGSEARHRWVAALPLHHAGGFMVAARAIVGGTLPVPLPGAGGAAGSAGRFSVDQLSAATQTAVDLSAEDGRPLAISLVPAQLVTVRDAGAPGLDVLRRFDVVLVGGAAAPAALLASLRAQGVRVRTSYGMTETCGGAVFDGVPLPGTTVRVDKLGRLRVVGDQVALGYRDGRTPDRWFVERDGRRGFLTDDLGGVDPDGSVRVTGRRDDVVQVGGASVAVAAVADVLAADPAVREVQVVAVEHPRLGTALVAFVAPTRGACTMDPGQGADRGELTTDPDAPGGGRAAGLGGSDARGSRTRLTDRLTDRVVAALGPAARPRRIVLTAALPLAETGKPDRSALLERARHALADPSD